MKKTLLLFVVSIFTFGLAPISAQTNKQENTSLIQSAAQNNLTQVQELITQGANVNVKDKYYKTPLHYAAQNNNLKMVEVLVENGAEIDAKDSNKETPLYTAVSVQSDKMVKYLASKGANPNPTHKKSIPALMLAISNGDLNIVETLMQNGAKADYDTLVMTIGQIDLGLNGREKVLKVLTKYGTDINMISPKKPYRNVLESAIINNDFKVAKMLAKLGANLEKSNMKEAYLFMVVKDYNNKDLTKLLIQNGANVNAKNSDGETVLDVARSKDIIKLLRKNGAKRSKNLK